jgi:hypothetical protein
VALACKICIATRGLRGSEIDTLPQTEQELIAHIERVHHMPVQRDGETREASIERFLRAYPEAKSCPECRAAGAPWAQAGG